MSEWAAKRFWTTVEVTEAEGGFAVTLDGRSVRTPAKAELVMPTRALAEMVAAEWDAQEDKIDPETMPVTRAMNAALDKVRGQFHEVAEMLSAYGGTDLLCYRADSPAGLVERQAQNWDPLLEWASNRFGVQWNTVAGLMPEPQPEDTVEKLGGEIAKFSPHQLTAFHDLVAMSGSLVIALAVTEGHVAPQEAWAASRIDEDWQIEQWGKDDEATALAESRKAAFLIAAQIFAACEGR